MADYLTDPVLSLTAPVADQLLAAGEGDLVLLYLALLRHSDPESARKSLRWNRDRTDTAWQALMKMGLISLPNSSQDAALPENISPPDYTQSDLVQALSDESPFSALYQLTEQRLGKKLSSSELKSLYEIYDYLAMPAEVILTLLTWCIQETQEKYGPGHFPRMPEIKRTAYTWHRLGLDTIEATEEYLKTRSFLQNRERDILPLLGIDDRPLLKKEQEYIDAWIQMGFPDDAIRLAYERTIMKKQNFHWGYMNSILKSWDNKGLHTVIEIESKDGQGKRQTVTNNTSSDQAAERLKQDIAWLEQFTKDNNRG